MHRLGTMIRRPSQPARAVAIAGGIAVLMCLAAAEPALAQSRRTGVGDLANYPGLANVQLQYDSVRIEGTVFFLDGDVDLIDPTSGVRLLADTLSFDTATTEFEASGRVSFEQGEMLLNGSAMRGDLDDGTLEMEDVVGLAPGPFYVRAKKIVQLEPGKFKVEKGVVTPCNQTTSIWEFRSGNMTLKPGSYVKMSWPHIRVKGMPIFGFPYMYWPLQDSHRQTGFLIPAIGTSSLKGFKFSEAFFWATSRSTDLTLTYEHFAKAGNGFAGEFRYAMSGANGGYIRSYYLPGRIVTPEQEAQGETSFASGFFINGSHLQSLPGGFVLRAFANIVSSTEFARGFSDNVDRFLQRQSVFSGDISRSWGASTLNIVADHVENFNNALVSTIGRKLPQIRYNLRSTQVFGPMYVAGQASVSRLQKLQVARRQNNTKINGGTYNRYDAFPDISFQLTQIPWLTFNPFFRWRATYWTHSETRREFKFREVPLFRNLYETGIEVVGPSIFRIFDTPSSDYSPRLKHIVQPRLTYRRVNQLEFKLDDRIIQFDEVDSFIRDSESMQLELTTRLFAKRYLSRSDEQRQVWQVAEFTIGRSWDLVPFDEISEALGIPRIQVPYFSTLIVQPTSRVYLRTDMGFTTGFTPASFSFNTTFSAEGGRIGVTWFRGVRNFLDPEDPSKVLVETNSNSLRANGSVDLFAQRITVGGGADIDLFTDRLQNIQGSLAWNLQCCSIGLTLQRLNLTGREETSFSLILNLAQVGTLGFDNNER